MSVSARVAAVGAFFALMLVGLLLGGDARELTPTSFGKAPLGHGAVYDLLRELGFDSARSFAGPEGLPPGATVWWIQPNEGCEAPPLAGDAFGQWLAGGGKAAVFLPARLDACASLAGLPLPAREVDLGAAPPEPEEETVASEAGSEPRAAVLEGPLLRAARRLELPAPVCFVPETAGSGAEGAGVGKGAFEVAATLDGRPFALARTVGAGRLLVVADGRFLENRWLGRADAAPLAIDVALALGTPWIDERGHGLVPSRGTLAYLARSPAVLPFAGLALLALAFAWWGAAEPARRVPEVDPAGPTLETYVQSMAGLYAATSDNARVLARYRELTARRLRRHLGLPPDAPLATLAERLARRASLSPGGLEELSSEQPVGTAAALARAAARLDRLVEEAIR